MCAWTKAMHKPWFIDEKTINVKYHNQYCIILVHNSQFDEYFKDLVLGSHFKDERSIIWGFFHAYNVLKIFFNVLYEGFYLDSIMHYVVQWIIMYLLTKVNFNFIWSNH